MTTLSRNLFSISRNGIASPIVRLGFARFSWLLPVRRVMSTGDVIAFHHPRPSWSTHILIIPKRGISGLATIGERELSYLSAVFDTARDISTSLDLEDASLVINGGTWQDVGQLHAHLLAADDTLRFDDPSPTGEAVKMHPDGARPFHAVITPPVSLPQLEAARFVIDAVQRLVHEHDLATAGFAIVVDPRRLATIHLVSGSAASPGATDKGGGIPMTMRSTIME